MTMNGGLSMHRGVTCSDVLFDAHKVVFCIEHEAGDCVGAVQGHRVVLLIEFFRGAAPYKPKASTDSNNNN